MQVNVPADEDKVITFPWGLPGFTQLRRFVLVPEEKEKLFGWLASLEDESIAFLVVDPFVFFPGYFVDINDQDARELELDAPSQALVLAIVSVPDREIKAATANLLAPVVINSRRRLAKQVILHASPFTTQYPLFPELHSVQTAASSAGEDLNCWS